MPVNVSSPETVNAVVTGVATAANQVSQIALETSLDGKFPAAAAAGDAESNATTMTAARTRGEVFNGTTWDRVRGALAGVTAGVIATWTGMAQTLGLSRYLAARPTLADGQGTHLQSNTRGDLATQEQYLPDYEDNANDVAWTGNRALAVSTGAWTNYNSGTTKVGNGAGLSIKASSGRLRGVGGVNTSAGTAYYLVVVNKTGTGGGAVANNDAVVAAVPLDKTTSWSGSSGTIDFGPEGIYLSTGISLALSTSPEKVTFAAANDAFFWALYL